jgi:hypothetical protein
MPRRRPRLPDSHHGKLVGEANQFATICGVLLPSHAANMAGSRLWSPQHSAMERRSTVQAATASRPRPAGLQYANFKTHVRSQTFLLAKMKRLNAFFVPDSTIHQAMKVVAGARRFSFTA